MSRCPADKAAEIGVNWAVGDADLAIPPLGRSFTRFDLPSNFAGAASSGLGGGRTAADPVAPALIGKGLTLGVGRTLGFRRQLRGADQGPRSDADTNIIGTPVLVTMDNEEAEIKVGQEVPFVTGQFTDTGTTGRHHRVNPFQTDSARAGRSDAQADASDQRGRRCPLKIEQELSSPAGRSSGSIGPDYEQPHRSHVGYRRRRRNTGPRRPDPGQTSANPSSEFPVLGSIPLARSALPVGQRHQEEDQPRWSSSNRHIARDAQAAFETNAKYNYVRNQQLGPEPGHGHADARRERPLLPPIAPAAPPAIDLRQLRTDTPAAAGEPSSEPDGNAMKPPAP